MAQPRAWIVKDDDGNESWSYDSLEAAEDQALATANETGRPASIEQATKRGRIPVKTVLPLQT